MRGIRLKYLLPTLALAMLFVVVITLFCFDASPRNKTDEPVAKELNEKPESPSETTNRLSKPWT
ncbi:MAG: hypothetical protein N2C14_22410, partial [Planctomycetales bacterium]